MKDPTGLRAEIKKRVSKSDVLLVGFLLFLGIGTLLFVKVMRNQNGTAVEITIDGAIYGAYDLLEDQTIPIKVHGIVTNTLQISEGKAKMIQADCPDQLCIHQRAVSGRGETIVCLPNKIVVEVKGENTAEVDSISR